MENVVEAVALGLLPKEAIEATYAVRPDLRPKVDPLTGKPVEGAAVAQPAAGQAA